MSQKVNLWNFGVGSYIQKEQDEKCSLAKNQSVDANERGDVTSILEQKVLRTLHFLTHKTPISRVGTAMAPSLAPPWSKLFGRNEKWSSQISTFFLWVGGGGGGGGGVVEYL